MKPTKRELERTIEDINHRNQVFFSKSRTSYSYNLRFKSGEVVIYTKVWNSKTYKLFYSKSRKAAKFLNVSYN